jgi:Holliday junction resolvasome RuvABC endonuclease subunit
MKILALDVATKTGWALGNLTSLTGQTECIGGTWNFSPKRDESGGMRLLRFKSKVKEIITLEKPDIVVFERTAGRHVNAIIIQAELHGVLKSLLDDNGIEYKAYSAPEIKKFATGKGNAGKPQMVQACTHKLGIVPEDDNHADAIWMYKLAQEDFKHLAGPKQGELL